MYLYQAVYGVPNVFQVQELYIEWRIGNSHCASVYLDTYCLACHSFVSLIPIYHILLCILTLFILSVV